MFIKGKNYIAKTFYINLNLVDYMEISKVEDGEYYILNAWIGEEMYTIMEADNEIELETQIDAILSANNLLT